MGDNDQRFVSEDNRPMAIAARYTGSSDMSLRPNGIDPKFTRRKKLPADQVAAFLKRVTKAIEDKQSLIIHSSLANSIRFPQMTVGGRDEPTRILPEVVLRGRPWPLEVEEGRRSLADTYKLMSPLELERVLGDPTWLSELSNGSFEICDEVPESVMNPVQLLGIENDRLRKRVADLEERIRPRSQADMEATRRASLSDEDRAREDAAAVETARISNQG
jgi:hypothetical protein